MNYSPTPTAGSGLSLTLSLRVSAFRATAWRQAGPACLVSGFNTTTAVAIEVVKQQSVIPVRIVLTFRDIS
jgi:hypothetical protein